MKLEKFEDMIQKDLAWRKLEVSHLFLILSEVSTKEIVMKSIVLLLYAHWEGFIKKSSKYYLKYINEKKIRIKDLTINFKAIVLKKFAADCIDNDGYNLMKEIAFMNKQVRMDDKKFKIDIDIDNDLDKDIINTKNNLNSKVLRNITEIIGTKYNAAMSTRSHYIDAQLLDNRNAIGHGSKILSEDLDNKKLSYKEIQHLKEFVLILLDYYSQILLDYASNEFYLQSKSDLREQYENTKEEELRHSLEVLERKFTNSKESK